MEKLTSPSTKYVLHWAVFQPNCEKDNHYDLIRPPNCSGTLITGVNRVKRLIHEASLPDSPKTYLVWFDYSSDTYVLALVSPHTIAGRQRIEKRYVYLFLPRKIMNGILAFNPLNAVKWGWLEQVIECYHRDPMYHSMSVEVTSGMHSQRESGYSADTDAVTPEPVQEWNDTNRENLLDYVEAQARLQRTVTFATWLPSLKSPPNDLFSVILSPKTPELPTKSDAQNSDATALALSLVNDVAGLTSSLKAQAKELQAVRRQASRLHKTLKRTTTWELDSPRTFQMKEDAQKVQVSLGEVLKALSDVNILTSLQENATRMSDAIVQLEKPAKADPLEPDKPPRMRRFTVPREKVKRILTYSGVIAGIIVICLLAFLDNTNQATTEFGDSDPIAAILHQSGAIEAEIKAQMVNRVAKLWKKESLSTNSLSVRQTTLQRMAVHDVRLKCIEQNVLPKEQVDAVFEWKENANKPDMGYPDVSKRLKLVERVYELGATELGRWGKKQKNREAANKDE